MTARRVLGAWDMTPDPILEATRLAHVLADLLEHSAATQDDLREQSETRYAEALARTLLDQLQEMSAVRALLPRGS
jgi:hypothetical protein